MEGVEKNESLDDTLARERGETEVPGMAWSGICMRSTWKPSTDDPSGRTPMELRGVHQSRNTPPSTLHTPHSLLPLALRRRCGCV